MTMHSIAYNSKLMTDFAGNVRNNDRSDYNYKVISHLLI